MKVTFLGTGTSQGVPVIGCDCAVCKSTDPKNNRLRSSVLIETDTTNFVVDTGPDFRYQMLKSGVKKLDAILYTHEHKDHLAGLDDVRAFNYFQKKPMRLYATVATQNAIKRDFYYAFGENPYPGVPRLELNTIDTTPFEVDGIEVIPILVWHYKMPVLGFRIGNFAYITDANRIDDEEMAKLGGVEVLVLNALRRESHISHFTFDEAVDVINGLKPKQAYLTHISHQLGLHDDVNRELRPGIELAYDGLTVDLD